MPLTPFQMDPFEPVFTWIDPDTKVCTHWASGRIADWCKGAGLEIAWTPVSLIYAAMFIKDRGIETHRLERLSVDHLADPIIYLDMGDGTHLLVDGHHRYVYAAAAGRDELPAYIITKDQAEPFLVTGLRDDTEDDLRNSYSGF